MSGRKQHNAHVRAWRRLIARVVTRRYEWGLPEKLRRNRDGTGKDGEELRVAVERDAARRIAAYKWPKSDWGLKYGPYSPFEKQEVVGRYSDIPTNIIHSIMCTEPFKDC